MGEKIEKVLLSDYFSIPACRDIFLHLSELSGTWFVASDQYVCELGNGAAGACPECFEEGEEVVTVGPRDELPGDDETKPKEGVVRSVELWGDGWVCFSALFFGRRRYRFLQVKEMEVCTGGGVGESVVMVKWNVVFLAGGT